ncbi:MAG TPA: helix-turn-helix domain-containing GNAT family N-acetyltransferase [Alphaproteobacteria bacterium]|nr:helix-turn-helix domain-containing GNAT family N-acetyltransferase [Alphaproteobacteria bacterium]
MMKAETDFDARVAAVRRFNRFYTQKIGVLVDGMLKSPFSLAEARVLYELAHRERPTATEIARDLGLDPGYLSRILRGFARRRLIRKERSASDGRQSLLALTDAGRVAFAPLDSGSRAAIGKLLGTLPAGQQNRLTGAMHEIEGLLGANPEKRVPYLLRPHRPGDLGWIVHRHGALYAEEYGFDERFEALVARIAADFLERHDPKRERCWIAERDGAVIGSVMLVKKSATVAKLRLLLVEPEARGLGVGARLVDECIRFARQAGYRKITLWTNSVLHAARRLYEQAGFKKVGEETHAMFGPTMTGETWELKL